MFRLVGRLAVAVLVERWVERYEAKKARNRLALFALQVRVYATGLDELNRSMQRLAASMDDVSKPRKGPPKNYRRDIAALRREAKRRIAALRREAKRRIAARGDRRGFIPPRTVPLAYYRVRANYIGGQYSYHDERFATRGEAEEAALMFHESYARRGRAYPNAPHFSVEPVFAEEGNNEQQGGEDFGRRE